MAHPKPVQALTLTAVLVTLACNGATSLDSESSLSEATGGATASAASGGTIAGVTNAAGSAIAAYGGTSNGGTSNGGNLPDAAGGSSQTGASNTAALGLFGTYVDADGRCRAAQAPMTTCPATFEQAQAQSNCSGICGGIAVSIHFWTPSSGCAYDTATGAYVGAMYWDDVPVYCNYTTAKVISGAWPLAPAGCTLSPVRVGGDPCPVGFVP